jgi:hypothetical protein
VGVGRGEETEVVMGLLSGVGLAKPPEEFQDFGFARSHQFPQDPGHARFLVRGQLRDSRRLTQLGGHDGQAAGGMQDSAAIRT